MPAACSQSPGAQAVLVESQKPRRAVSKGCVDVHMQSQKPRKVGSKGCEAASDPETCLLQAALSNDTNMIKVLAVMDRNALKKHIDYALLYAIRAGSYEVVKTMFRYGASLDAKDLQHSIWDLAKQSPDPEAMNDLLLQMESPFATEEIRSKFSGMDLMMKKSKKEQGQASRPRTSSIVRRAPKGLMSRLTTI